MVTTLLVSGALMVAFLFFYSRWLDDETLADICWYALCYELISAACLYSYVSWTGSALYIEVGQLMVLAPSCDIRLIFVFDQLSGFFFCILAFALLLCFYFLVDYFEYDAGATTIILLSAAFSQLALWYFCVFDLFLLITFWEAISFISFFLVQHWAHRLPTYKAGLKVFFISQLGDLPFFVFLFVLFNRIGSSDMLLIQAQLPLLSYEYLALGPLYLNLNLLLACCLSSALLLKAAQFFFYPWLLDAMEAPVPISAQLHSSTLVIIGFYLFFRFNDLFLLAPQVNQLLLGAGVLTVVGASLLAFFQEDGKRLLACSTASQLGYVVAALGLTLYEEAALLLAFCCCNKAITFI